MLPRMTAEEQQAQEKTSPVTLPSQKTKNTISGSRPSSSFAVGQRVKMTKEIFCSFYERLDAEVKKDLLMGYRKINNSATKTINNKAPGNTEVRPKGTMSS